MESSNVLYSIILKEIFDVKIVYAINSKLYTSIHYDTLNRKWKMSYLFIIFNNKKVSICLVRNHDGIIYNTGFHYTYHSPSQQTPAVNVKQPQQQQQYQPNFETSKMFGSRVSSNSKDNPTIYMPRPSLKRPSINYD